MFLVCIAIIPKSSLVCYLMGSEIVAVSRSFGCYCQGHRVTIVDNCYKGVVPSICDLIVSITTKIWVQIVKKGLERLQLLSDDLPHSHSHVVD